MLQGIYAIVNSVSGGIYVGSSVNIFARFNVHLGDLKNGNHACPPLQRAWDIYGKTAFSLALLEIVDRKEDLISREQYYLDTIAEKYNCCKIAGRPPDRTGAIFSQESIEKMRASQRGSRRSPRTPEHTRKLADAIRGRSFQTDASKEKLRQINLGKKWPPEFGKKVSDGIKRATAKKGKRYDHR